VSLTLEYAGPAPVVRPPPHAGCDYRLAGSIGELREYLRPALEDREPFGADWEATSLNTLIARPVGLGVSVSDKTGIYAPVGHFVDPEANLPLHEVVSALRDADHAGATSLWYNVAYDHEISQTAGFEPTHWHDVYAAVSLVDTSVFELGLKLSSLRFLGEPMLELADLDPDWQALPRSRQKVTPFRLPHLLSPLAVYRYGCDDPEKTRRIWRHPLVTAAVRAQARTLRLEEQVSARIREGTRHGVVLDPDVLTRLIAETTARLQTLQGEIWTLLGEDIALGRKAYLGQALLRLGVPITERTPTGLPTVRLPILERYRDTHPVVPKLIAFAHLTTQQDNYLVKLQQAHAYFATQPWAGGTVRFAFGHLGVPTGRMKCGGAGKGLTAYAKGVVDVNAQSIPDPHKTPDLPNIRSAFVAPPAMVVVALDYNQMELRLMANLSGEPRWIETFRTGGDIHLSNAQAIADAHGPTPPIEKDDPRRGKAKATGFALLYGGDAHTVANHTGLTQKAAEQLVQQFFVANPRIHRWMQQTAQHAVQTKTARTFFGRIRHLHAFFPTPPPQPPRGTPKTTPESKAYWRYLKEKARGEREAINHPIQGTAADVFKHALTTLHTALLPYGPGLVSPPILWMHDEIVFYCHHDWVTTIVPTAIDALTVRHPHWPVPLTVEAELGPSWGTLVPYAQWRETHGATHD